MPSVHDADVLVVGAGIAGASIAWFLAPHARVAVLEREAQPGVHSTGRSAAMFIESYGTPQVRALTRASRAFLEHPADGFAAQPLLAPRGTLYVAGADQLALLDALEAEVRPHAAQARRLDAAALRRLVPVLEPAASHAGLLDPGAADIDVNELHQGFLRGLRRAGGSLHCGVSIRSIQHD
ncbi:MAG TPA: FAD-dependent oxidoreductase, partial [Burkholderiaceae bacterium]